MHDHRWNVLNERKLITRDEKLMNFDEENPFLLATRNKIMCFRENEVFFQFFAKLKFHLIAEYEVSRLTSSVYAWIFSIPFPYLGIDGTSACNNLSLRNGAPTTCPIRKGQQYKYKAAIEVKATYPKVENITLN